MARIQKHKNKELTLCCAKIDFDINLNEWVLFTKATFYDDFDFWSFDDFLPCLFFATKLEYNQMCVRALLYTHIYIYIHTHIYIYTHVFKQRIIVFGWYLNSA